MNDLSLLDEGDASELLQKSGEFWRPRACYRQSLHVGFSVIDYISLFIFAFKILFYYYTFYTYLTIL